MINKMTSFSDDEFKKLKDFFELLHTKCRVEDYSSHFDCKADDNNSVLVFSWDDSGMMGWHDEVMNDKTRFTLTKVSLELPDDEIKELRAYDRRVDMIREHCDDCRVIKYSRSRGFNDSDLNNTEILVKGLLGIPETIRIEYYQNIGSW